jgi:metal transporter CNNM
VSLITELQGIVAWPIAKILEFTLGAHHGIIYRRAGTISPLLSSSCCDDDSVELKELIALHSSVGEYGGDLRSDTVTIIGATLDLQEKTTSHVRLSYLLINQNLTLR